MGFHFDSFRLRYRLDIGKTTRTPMKIRLFESQHTLAIEIETVECTGIRLQDTFANRGSPAARCCCSSAADTWKTPPIQFLEHKSADHVIMIDCKTLWIGLILSKMVIVVVVVACCGYSLWVSSSSLAASLLLKVISLVKFWGRSAKNQVNVRGVPNRSG